MSRSSTGRSVASGEGTEVEVLPHPAFGHPLPTGEGSDVVFSSELAVMEAHVADPERRRVEVTIIRPGTSANGLRYTEEALRASLPLWEGAAAFVDHPD